VASSQRYSASLHEIETQWCLDDVYDANVVLDLYDELERKATKAAERGRKK
jgi:hypothetical protein